MTGFKLDEEPRRRKTRRFNRTNESLEDVFRRVIEDSRAVGTRATPRTLALAAGAAGWKHDHAVLTSDGSLRPRMEAGEDEE